MNKLPLSLAHIREVLTEYFADKAVQQVEIFGSYARNEATSQSDLDVLLTSIPGHELTPINLVIFQMDLEVRLGLPIDILTKIPPFIRPKVERDLQTVTARPGRS